MVQAFPTSDFSRTSISEAGEVARFTRIAQRGMRNNFILFHYLSRIMLGHRRGPHNEPHAGKMIGPG